MTHYNKSDSFQTVKTDVVVIVEDANDNAPTFTQEEYRFTLKENPELAAEVGNVFASDPDSGPNGRVIYTMENRGDVNSFGISEVRLLKNYINKLIHIQEVNDT